MNKKMPPFKSITAFESVVRLGSVTKAAEELFVTHGAISKQIAALEDWLGRPLFETNRRQMRPLPDAITWAGTLADVLNMLETSSAQLRIDSRARPLRIIAPSTLAARWLLPRSWQFSELHRDIALQVRHTDSGEHWQQIPFDVAIRTGQDVTSSLQSVPIFQEELTLALTPALASISELWRPADIFRLRLLTSQTRNGELQRWMAAAGLSNPPGNVTTFPHFYLALEATLAGSGALVCPLHTLADHFARGDLVEPFPHARVKGPTFHALWREQSGRTQDVDRFVSWLVELASHRDPAGLAKANTANSIGVTYNQQASTTANANSAP